MHLTRENVAREYGRYTRALPPGVHVRIVLDEPGMTVAQAQHRGLVHMEQRHGPRHRLVSTIIVDGAFIILGKEVV